MELFQLPKAFLQMNTIFISILIEALPFVLIGVFISGFIQMFVTEDMVAKWMPKNRFLSVYPLFCCFQEPCIVMYTDSS
ncbi:permease, partial [Bacillus sp. B-TM1]